MTILERIKLNSAKHPERVVMRTQYGFGEMTMKWGELDAFSDKLAYYLTKELRTNKPIIVYGHKHPMMLVCFLACVKSGRAYCPIDVNVPLSRTEAIIREVEPEIILTTEPLEIDSDRIKELQEINEIISTTDGKADSSNYVTAEDVFYIIFTSGSTGTPKGVQITRDCLDNFIKWALCLGSGTAQEKVYNVKLADFSQKEYEIYFLRDIMHLGWKGWVYLDRAVYEFYNNQPITDTTTYEILTPEATAASDGAEVQNDGSYRLAGYGQTDAITISLPHEQTELDHTNKAEYRSGTYLHTGESGTYTVRMAWGDVYVDSIYFLEKGSIYQIKYDVAAISSTCAVVDDFTFSKISY